MYCNHCGQTLPDGSRFCNHCGAQLSPAAAGTPRASVAPEGIGLQDDGFADGPGSAGGLEGQAERVAFTLRPTMTFVIMWYVLAAVATVVVAATAGFLKGKAINNDQTSFVIIGCFAVVAFSVPLYKHVLRRREVYTLTNHKLEMRYGILAKTVRNIPIRNIQDVTVIATAWQRLLGLGDIEIDSASESGKILLREIHRPERYADMILGELRRRY